MSIELLDKTRRINRLLNKREVNIIDFKDFCHVLSGILSANVALLSRKGKLLGVMERTEIPAVPPFERTRYGKYIDSKVKDRLLDILSTNENVNLSLLGVSAERGSAERPGSCFMMVTPVAMGGERLGSLIVYRPEEAFSIDDVILNEYSATVIGLAMQRSVSEEMTEESSREEEVAALYQTLSRLEKQAILSILEEMSGQKEVLLITSKVSERVGITRSVIVNALKKCAGAGVLETRSAGKKGTYVKIRNELFFKSFPQDISLRELSR
ncbi:MAG: GTP-sensing pleiotropic transcriptional regulator CodY [Lachnospiraceae bacterium]|nr:GTP-sensing pleiotropic transcriptional regulator CodY [Lachnospiraceae bacterium]